MAGETRPPDTTTRLPVLTWRPTGKLSQHLARPMRRTALLSVLAAILLAALSLALEYRSALVADVDAAIAAGRGTVVDALGVNYQNGVKIAARQIAKDSGAAVVSVYNRDGATVAKVVQTRGQARKPQWDMPPWQRIVAQYLPEIPLPTVRITRELQINGDPVGTVEVQVSSRPVFLALVRFLGAALVAVVFALLVAMRFTRRLRVQVAEPAGRLVETMDKVATTKDFSLRATPEGPDEIGSLAISFNELLKLITTRNQTLAEHRRKLQELVIERTRSFEQAAREAEIASRAKSDFLARMSHEIRTPMNGVVGMAELLENTRLEEKQHHMLQTMRSSADALLDMINDILDFSRIEAGQLQVLKTQFSPVELIEEICELLAPKAHERDLELICDIESSVPEACAGDPLRLRQIVTNLLGNAIKYTEKGHIIVHAAAKQQADGVAQLLVEVEDTGLGIPEKQLEKMFEPFTQGESFESRKQGGTGLGLAITRQLVSLLGGEVEVTSRLGAGSKFWFTIPLQPVTGSEPSPRWKSGVKSVLVVQAHGAALKATTRLLEEVGSGAWTSQSGFAALDNVLIQDYELVMADELLPDMSGYEFIDRLRKSAKSKSFATILMTSSRPAAARLEHASEPDARVGKPVRRARLYEAIDQAMGRGEASASGLRSVGHDARLEMRVLLVEDSAVNREVAAGMLESLGCTVETAGDGSVGVEQALSGAFDAVLMDCQMPLVDGFEATQRIRAAEVSGGRKAVPIIALTANALQGDRERCLAVGMTDFISKPFTISKLQKALAAVKSGKPVFELAAPNPRLASAKAAGAPAAAAAPARAAAPAAAAAAPVIDRRHIEELRAIGKPQLLENAIALFRRQAAANLEEMERAVKAGSAAEMERRFHALKSCSVTVGAKRFADIAGECEQAARKGDVVAAGRLAVRLRPEYLVLCKALAEIAQAKGGAA